MGHLEIPDLTIKEVKDALKKGYIHIENDFMIPLIWSDEDFFFYIQEQNWLYRLTWEWYGGTIKDAKDEFEDLIARYPWYIDKWIQLIDLDWKNFVL